MKIKGIMKIALMVLAITMIFSSITYAENDNFSFTEIDSQSATADISEPVKDATGAVLSAIRIIGTGVALVMIAVVAMKYLIASPGDRADMKKASIQFVIGAFVVFGASNLLTILAEAIAGMVPVIS